MKKQDFFGEKAMIFWGKPVEKQRTSMGKSDGKTAVWESSFHVFHTAGVFLKNWVFRMAGLLLYVEI